MRNQALININSAKNRINKYFIAKVNKKILLKISFVLLLPLVGAPLHALVYIALILWSAQGPRQAIESLTLSWLASFLNPKIFHISGLSSFLRWGVLFSAFCTICPRYFLEKKGTPINSWIRVLLFSSFIGVTSFFISYAPVISLFKIATFLVGSSTVLQGFNMTRHLRKYWERWFILFFSTICILSITLTKNSLAYNNSFTFMGLFNQSQANAVFLAPFCTWLFFLLIERKKNGIGWWLLLSIAIVLLMLTKSRTGFLAATLGVLFIMVINFFRNKKQLQQNKSWFPMVILIFLLLTPFFFLYWAKIADFFVSFIFKRSIDNASTVGEALYASRGFLIARSFENFFKNPFLGIGFGVPSIPSLLNVKHDPVFGLPIGASIEKGFLPAAILEETGLIGSLLFIFLLISLFHPLLKKRETLSPSALAISAFCVNFGESAFFSFGGIGLWIWLLIGAARVIVVRGKSRKPRYSHNIPSNPKQFIGDER